MTVHIHCDFIVCLLLFYVLATAMVISGWVLMYDSAHSLRFYSSFAVVFCPSNSYGYIRTGFDVGQCTFMVIL